jgi:hypothetical protein
VSCKREEEEEEEEKKRREKPSRVGFRGYTG